MKSIYRITLAALSGLLLGGALQQFLKTSPPQASPQASSQPPESVQKKPPVRPEWLTWLEANAPLHPALRADNFYTSLPAAGSCTSAEWQLALDEAFFSMPADVFLAILQDERFARFPRTYEEESSTSWSRKLLASGLDNAVAMAGKMPTQWLNSQLEYTLLETLAKQDPWRGLTWLQQSAGRQDTNKLFLFLGQVAAHDTAVAGQMVAGLEPALRPHAAANLLKAIGDKDWRKAESWGKQYLSAEEWKRSAGSVFDEYTGSRIAELRSIGDQITDPDLRSAAYSRSVFWPVASCAETLDRALSFPEGSLNKKGWTEVATTCAMGNRYAPEPAAGAAELKAVIQRVPEEFRAAFELRVIKHACANDGPLAAQFYDIAQPEQVADMSNRWTSKDPAAVSAWLATLPPSDKREAAVLAFCREASAIDPAGAAAWALTISDPGKREVAIEQALAAWRQSEPAAAASWEAAR